MCGFLVRRAVCVCTQKPSERSDVLLRRSFRFDSIDFLWLGCCFGVVRVLFGLVVFFFFGNCVRFVFVECDGQTVAF